MLITFKCTEKTCGNLIHFEVTEEEVKKAEIFPVPIVIQHGDHAQVVYLDRALGIREVEVARHAETLLDYMLGFINEALIKTKSTDLYEIGLSVGQQIGEWMIKHRHEEQLYSLESFFESFTSHMKNVFSGGTIEYDLKAQKVHFKVINNPFCRTMIGERKTKSCMMLSGIIAGAAHTAIEDNPDLICEETSCHIVSGKDYCEFVLSELKKTKVKKKK